MLRLSHEFCWVPFESFLAGYAAEMERFAFVGDFELGRPFIKNGSAHGIFGHYLLLFLTRLG